MGDDYFYMGDFKATKISIVCRNKKELMNFIKECKGLKLRFKFERRGLFAKHRILKSYSWLFPKPICFAYNYGLDKNVIVGCDDINFFDNTEVFEYSELV